MTTLESLSAELTEYITQRIQEISPGRVECTFMLIIDRPSGSPHGPLVSGTASPDDREDLCNYILRSYNGPSE